MANIILTGGGTAGHCIPNLALIPYLKKHYNNIYYVGSKNGIEKKLCNKYNIPFYSITCVKLIRKFTLENIKIPFSLLKGIKECDKLINKLKPDVIFSKGGYVSLPLILSAKKHKIPTFTHESDYSIGLANKIACKYSKKVFTSFPETANHLKNGQYVGSPIRQEIYSRIDKQATLNKYMLLNNKPVLLVLGGSSGSKKINESIRANLKDLLKNYQVVHVCGKKNLDNKIIKKGYCQIEYCEQIEKLFGIAAVCVSRAGSNTLFEILIKKIPTLLIPLPKGISRGDQIQNAKYFYNKGMVNVLYEQDLSPTTLLNSINSTYANREKLIKNIDKNPVCNASKKIVDVITQTSCAQRNLAQNC